MKGQILHIDDHTGDGVIRAVNGSRYAFTAGDLKGSGQIAAVGVAVDFEAQEGRAVDVYPDPGAPRVARHDLPVHAGSKSRITAGLLAIFLGSLGIHKFYLGYNGAGAVMALATLFGWLFFFVPTWIVGIIAIVEGILYLLRTDEEFHEAYVVGHRPWF
ncbi:NINE protein [Paracoccus sp. S-4012]|uniref:TM2 domain-containing protein n=1 Tax=Paracoccus sp. S-4012 TaxID=2665648 RepID=UPI0012AF35D8|nr:TM2 domain-containing protein [Paracoccus sp. S-4012]MRX50597.1 NINE protein [Paracoccus sp. S-4012]